MAENKKSVLLYCDIIHTVKELSDEEAGKLFKHYLEYVNDLNPTAPDKLTQIVFEPIKQNLKRDLKKWESQINQRSEAGKKGMEKRWNNKNNGTITNDNTVINPITNITVKDTVTDTVNVNDIYFKDLPNSLNFETICRQTGLTKDFLTSKIPTFKPYARVNYPNFNEFCDHFKSWTLKNKSNIITPTRRQTK